MKIDMPKSLNDLLSTLDKEGIQDYQRYSTMQRYLTLSAWKKNVPITGCFELTPLCNFDCKMCYTHLTRDQMKGKELLSVEQWKSIMSQAVQNGMMFAELTGGECLSYPGFEEVYLHLMSMGVNVAVLTNGSLVSERTIELFKTQPPSSVQITIYGSSNDVYEHVTGKRAFESVIRNVKLLKQAGIPVNLSITASSYMLDDAESLKKLVDKLGIPYRISTIVFEPHEETERVLFDSDISEIDRMELIRLFRHLPHDTIEDGIRIVGLPEAVDQGIACGAGRNAYVIGWNGEMTLCHNFRPVRVDVLKDGLKKAWQEVNAAALKYKYPSVCSSCVYKKKCIRCPAEIEQLIKTTGKITRICNRMLK